MKAYGNYVKVHVPDKTFLISQTMKSLEENLPASIFIRVHKSFIVSFDKIDKIDGNIVVIKNIRIPVGKYYKKGFEKMLIRYRV